MATLTARRVLPDGTADIGEYRISAISPTGDEVVDGDAHQVLSGVVRRRVGARDTEMAITLVDLTDPDVTPPGSRYRILFISRSGARSVRWWDGASDAFIDELEETSYEIEGVTPDLYNRSQMLLAEMQELASTGGAVAYDDEPVWSALADETDARLTADDFLNSKIDSTLVVTPAEVDVQDLTTLFENGLL